LLRHPLLHLQATGEHLHDARDLAQADDLALGNVGHVHLPQEGQQVMLAQAVEVNVAHDDHLIVLDIEDGVVDEPHGVHVVAGGEFGVSTRDAGRRVEQPFALHVLADGREDVTHGAFNLTAAGPSGRVGQIVAEDVVIRGVNFQWLMHQGFLLRK